MSGPASAAAKFNGWLERGCWPGNRSWSVIDDLSSALDVTTEAEVWRRLRARTDIACLAVSHRHPVLQMADRILVLKAARLEDSGTLAELLARCPEMQAVWHQEGRGAERTKVIEVLHSEQEDV